MDPERALQRAIVDRLKADGALAAWLGAPARVWDEPPADLEAADYPYVAFGRAETRPVAADGGAFEHRLTVTCVSRYGGSEEAKAVTGGVRAALEASAPALESDGWRCVDLRVTYTDVYRSSDLRSTYGVVRTRAVMEPAV